jgi:proline iminopeptidase
LYCRLTARPALVRNEESDFYCGGKTMSQTSAEEFLFPPIEPYAHGMLKVDDIHTLYWEQCGNPDGVPVLFLHGGPGSGATTTHRRFFDPEHYRIVLFDQRGAGRSTPLGEIRDNTTPLLVKDIERLREMLGIGEWLVFGGSWGSTLALAYGEAHPERCTGFVLRGIFLCTRAEIDWFMNGIRWFYPELHKKFIAPIPQAERRDLLRAYCERLFSDDPEVYLPVARTWAEYEAGCLFLRPDPDAVTQFGSQNVSVGLARLEAHYFSHDGFFFDDQLIRNVDRISHLPAVIVQGRYDIVCPLLSAYRLHEAWPEARFHIIADAGHAATEPGTAAALIAATEQFRQKGHFD